MNLQILLYRKACTEASIDLFQLYVLSCLYPMNYHRLLAFTKNLLPFLPGHTTRLHLANIPYS